MRFFFTLVLFIVASKPVRSEESILEAKKKFCLVEKDTGGRKFLPGAIMTKTPWKYRLTCLRRQCVTDACKEYQFSETTYFFDVSDRKSLNQDWKPDHHILNSKKFPVNSPGQLENIKDEIFAKKIRFSHHNLDYVPGDYTLNSLAICIYVPPIIAFALVADVVRTVTYPIVNPAAYYFKNLKIRKAIKRLAKGKGTLIPDTSFGLIKRDIKSY